MDLLKLGRIWSRLRGFRNAPPELPEAEAPCTHVILLDGTMSSLVPGNETNIGLTYRLLSELGPEARVNLYYEPGIQWRGIRRAAEVLAGVGINRQIRRAYAFLSRSYKPGDRIFLMGYSRGAYALRSLAGLIDKLGLMRSAQLSHDTMDRLYDLYQHAPDGAEARAFRAARCHEEVPITMMGVFDTVRALGLRWPLIWRLAPVVHEFHNHQLGPSIRIGRQALALQETREAFLPELWEVPEHRQNDIEQMWFTGSHGDIGGNLGGHNESRPLSNIPLVWMLGEAEAQGLPLPHHWRTRYICDASASSVGTFKSWGKLFWFRRRRKVGLDPSERIHASARAVASSAGLRVEADGRFMLPG